MDIKIKKKKEIVILSYIFGRKNAKVKECRMNMTFICLVEKKNERTNHLTMLP